MLAIKLSNSIRFFSKLLILLLLFYFIFLLSKIWNCSISWVTLFSLLGQLIFFIKWKWFIILHSSFAILLQYGVMFYFNRKLIYTCWKMISPFIMRVKFDTITTVIQSLSNIFCFVKIVLNKVWNLQYWTICVINILVWLTEFALTM